MSKIKAWSSNVKEYSQLGTMLTNWIFGNWQFVLFIFILLIAYISNSLYGERKVRQILQFEKEIKEMRWKYMSEKSNLILNSKQSEISRLVQPLNLSTSNARRKRIIINE